MSKKTKKTKTNDQFRKMESGQEFQREFNIRMEGVNDDNMTVDFSFSSEDAEVPRYYGREVLSHDTGAVRLERINNGGAFLVNHDTDQHVGVIVEGSARIDADRRGRATARFGNSAFAKEIFDDIKNGIRKLISVRYRVIAWVESEQDGLMTRTITEWEPTEISTVSIPADDSVGIGRNINNETENSTMTKAEKEAARKKKLAAEAKRKAELEALADDLDEDQRDLDEDLDVDPEPAPPTQQRSQPTRQTRQQVATAEMERIDSIRSMGDEHGYEELARQAIDSHWSYARFNKALLSKIGEQNAQARSEAQDADGDVDLDGTDARQFSLSRLMFALGNPNDRNAQRAAEHEFAISEEGAKQFGADFNVRGAYIPNSVLEYSPAHKAASDQRALSEGLQAGAGPELIANTLLAGSYIEVLRNAMVMMQAGATMMPGLKGTHDIPRQLSGASSVWLTAEDEEASESQATFDQISLSPKDLACFTEVTRRSLMNSTPSTEGIVRNDLLIAQALGIDHATLYGTGANGQPRGVINQAGINTVDFAADQPTFQETVTMIKEMMLDNAHMGSLGYMLDPNGWEHGYTTEKFADTGKTIISEANTINGSSYQMSNQVAEGDWFYGNWSDVLIGEWGGLELNVDPYTHSLKGRVRFIVFKTTDVQIRRPQSFVLGKNLT